MKVPVLAALVLAAFSVRADVVQSPSGVGSCTIPDNSTLTSISVSDSSNPLWDLFTSCTYTFAGGSGWTLAAGNYIQYGDIIFDTPVTDVVYDFDYSYWFEGPGTLTMGLPTNPNGEGIMDGPVSSIYWAAPSNSTFNYNGVVDFSFSSLGDPATVPDPSGFIPMLMGLTALLIAYILWRRRPNQPDL